MNNATDRTHDDDTEVIAQVDETTPIDETTQVEDTVLEHTAQTTELDVPLSERFADFDDDANAIPDDGDTREMPAQTRVMPAQTRAADDTTIVIEQVDVADDTPTSALPVSDDATQPLSGWSWSSDAADDVTETVTDGDTVAEANTVVDDDATGDGETMDSAAQDADTRTAVDDAAAYTASADVPPTPPADGVPMYSAPQPDIVPKDPVRPSGPSAATIVFGSIVTLVGVITIVIAACMNTNTLQFVDWRETINWILMGLGVLLSVVAIVWGVVAHVRNRRRDTAPPQP
ncbi:hypothetical protein [Bifidobacterium criceti]|nr:hypothetical protein [Bifidobacterium criceti]